MTRTASPHLTHDTPPLGVRVESERSFNQQDRGVVVVTTQTAAVSDTSCSFGGAFKTEVGPTSARKANAKLREVEPTAAVFSLR